MELPAGNGTSSEDARKKRVCAQVDQKEEEEKPKKVRVQSSASRNMSPTRRLVVRDSSTAARQDLPSKAAATSREIAASGKSESPSTTTATTTTTTTATSLMMEGKNHYQVWDLESALLYLVRVEGAREYITNDKSTWVTFRAGHAGDASTIASLYRQSKRRNMQENSPELETAQIIDNNSAAEEESSVSSMLEVWLADGMGDEDTPPSVYSLLAHVHTGTTIQDPSPAASESSTPPPTITPTLGAVSLLTLAWADGERILRVEWMHVDPSLPPEVSLTLEKRLWLRLSSLSLMTACQLLTVDEQHTSPADASEEVSKPLPPSAE
jgi:hypothetical protein